MSLLGLDFINQCLQYDNSKRPTLAQLVEHPYLQPDLDEKDPLLLSYCEDTETYEEEFQHAAVLKNPYKWMAANRQNTIELNARESEKMTELIQQKIESR